MKKFGLVIIPSALISMMVLYPTLSNAADPTKPAAPAAPQYFTHHELISTRGSSLTFPKPSGSSDNKEYYKAINQKYEFCTGGHSVSRADISNHDASKCKAMADELNNQPGATNTTTHFFMPLAGPTTGPDDRVYYTTTCILDSSKSKYQAPNPFWVLTCVYVPST